MSVPFHDLTRREINEYHAPEKTGYRIEGEVPKDASHILGLQLAKDVLASRPGPKVTSHTQHERTASALNSSSNLRIKNQASNLIVDESLDEEILSGILYGTPITQKAATRAIRAADMLYEHTSSSYTSSRDLEYLEEQFNSLQVETGKPGRKPTVGSIASGNKTAYKASYGSSPSSTPYTSSKSSSKSSYSSPSSSSSYGYGYSSSYSYQSSFSSGPLKSDGTPDMRYKSNW